MKRIKQKSLKQIISTGIGLGLLLLFVSSCSNTRYLAENESLYKGAKIKVEDTNLNRGLQKAMAEDLKEIITPKPNRQFFGLRFKLWMYNIAGTPKKDKGFRNWMKNKVGEPPVLGSSMNIKANENLITNYLQNLGFFSAHAEGDKVIKKKKATAYFTVFPGIQDTIRNVVFNVDTNTSLGRHILETKSGSLLVPGMAYNLNNIINERERITQELKNKGYFYFNPDYIILRADTGIGGHQLDLSLEIKKDEISQDATEPFRINKVTIIPNYSVNTSSSSSSKDKNEPLKPWQRLGDTVYYPLGYSIVTRRDQFKPEVFKQAMQLRPSQIYSLRDQNMALNRLVTMGAFKFVKNEFTRVRDTKGNLLDVTYYLTPHPKKSLSIDLGGFTQNDNRVGTRLSVAWTNHNTFHGAELFTIKVSGGFDMQYGGEVKTPNVYNLGVDLGLNFPRFIVPFFRVKTSNQFVPRTLVNLSYGLTLAEAFYRINSFNLGGGYSWKETVEKEHKLFPISITYVRTDTLNSSRASEFNLSNLTFNGLIFGPSYQYTYNSQLNNRSTRNNFYFNGQADFSGNIIGWIQGTSLNKEPERILRQSYAQFARIQADGRFYRSFAKEKMLAIRGFFGFGLPYGNSRNLPNIRQFFSGGSNSLRGFSTRLVGPGTYHFSQAEGNNPFIEMLGDIKLEGNVEYRFPVYKFFKGAAFVDAGNIWLYRKNPDFPGGNFTKAFLNQLAVDAGLGLRMDFSILVLRMDFGFPIRKPWYPSGQRWQFNNIDFGSGAWRRDNIFFNLAIGYPF